MQQRLVRAQAQDRRGADPVPRAARRPAARAAGRRAARRLPRLQRGPHRDGGDRARRAASLCEEAIRLARLLARSCPTTPRRSACSRSCCSPTRGAPRGPTPTARSSRSTTRTAPLGRASASPRASRRSTRALRLRRPGPYQLQAAIAALHAEAPSFDATDWPQIAALYGELAPARPVAGRRDQPRGRGRVRRAARRRASRSSRRSTPTPRLDRYQPLHAARAELLRRAGDTRPPRAAYGRAIELSANARERDELHRRRRQRCYARRRGRGGRNANAFGVGSATLADARGRGGRGGRRAARSRGPRG